MGSHPGGSGNGCPCHSSKFTCSIWTAAHYGDAGRLKHLLIRHGRDPNACDEYGHCPLEFACAGGHEHCVQLLLSCGANPNGGTSGAFPLHKAAYRGHASIVRLLLSAGARLNERDGATGDGRTPLAKAASQGHADVCSLLLSAGADAAIPDTRGLQPWQLVPLDCSVRTDAGSSAFHDADCAYAVRAAGMLSSELKQALSSTAECNTPPSSSVANRISAAAAAALIAALAKAAFSSAGGGDNKQGQQLSQEQRDSVVEYYCKRPASASVLTGPQPTSAPETVLPDSVVSPIDALSPSVASASDSSSAPRLPPPPSSDRASAMTARCPLCGAEAFTFQRIPAALLVRRDANEEPALSGTSSAAPMATIARPLLPLLARTWCARPVLRPA